MNLFTKFVLFCLIVTYLLYGCAKEDLHKSSDSPKQQEHIIMTKQVYTGSLLMMDHSNRYTAECDVMYDCLKQLAILENGND